MSLRWISRVTQNHHPEGQVGGGFWSRPHPRSGFGPPHLILLPPIIMPVWYYGICAEKNSVSIQLATNKTNTTCHSGLSQKPPLPTSLPFSPPPLPHHMLVCFTTLFTFLLANYLPLSPCLSGSRAFSNRGNLSHSLIERLSGDYGEVRNKVVLRNHKHKPFLSLCWEIFFFLQQLFIIAVFFFFSQSREAYLSPENTLSWDSGALITDEEMERTEGC